ncbi:hypothetical protein OG936_37420 [Streptomyces sp. NBC_00846]|uniref:hypothetical protein n=1 Tax=Streptomyces sp. NBC_00846 TaxID=2975849 RepID=UPI00386FA170|nr:hypothetical protein OG936_37420 [Streptomyces sp. NBC_00846]
MSEEPTPQNTSQSAPDSKQTASACCAAIASLHQRAQQNAALRAQAAAGESGSESPSAELEHRPAPAP